MLGAISLVIWSLTLVVALKYLVFVLRADNDGEGGTFALYGLLHKFRARGLGSLLFILMLAAGLLFGEGIITPAISAPASSALSRNAGQCASSVRWSTVSSGRWRS